MRDRTEEIVRRLAERAEEVCRRYLSNGRKIGGYWIVGDRRNTKGRSLYLRLKSNGSRPAGKWTDGAAGEHGDLLDIIATAVGADRHADALAEAERFLGVEASVSRIDNSPRDSAAARLFAAGEPIARTPAATYLRSREIDHTVAGDTLRFHPSCYYSQPDTGQRLALPAMLAAVTDSDGYVTGLLRTYLSADGSRKAQVESPRRAMGALAGNGVRFGSAADVMAAGEGVETMLSLRMAMPTMAMIAALSASHLAALKPSPQLRRLYIAVDRDDAGRNATVRLQERLNAQGIETLHLHPQHKDFNDDLIADGLPMLRPHIADQLRADDRRRFIEAIANGGR